MGGYGSGRSGSRSTVEQCLILDASRWARERVLREESIRTGTWRWMRGEERVAFVDYSINTSQTSPTLGLTYRVAGVHQSYFIGLQTTEPRYGGLRWWFSCPLQMKGVPCGRRVRKLFLPPGSHYFGCRNCHNLTYDSRKENAMNRALTKTQRIRVRLGDSSSLSESFPPKPKGMWSGTYWRLRHKAEGAELRSWILLGEWMDRLERKTCG